MPDRYGVVGHPIAHSLSPTIHRLFAEATDQAVQYDRYDITPENFEREIRAFFDSGGRGLNVTVPHKERAAAWADELTPRARKAGAVNTLIKFDDGRIRGDNTDGAGLMADLARLGVAVADRRLLILGAGGATRGILGPLQDCRPREIVIANRTPERAKALVGDQGCSYDGLNVFLERGDFDLVIHATPLGLTGGVPAVSPAIMGQHTFAYDLGYGKPDTPFIRWARQHGAAGVAQGLGMLVEQAAESFWLWRGVRPDTSSAHQQITASD
ncbi:MAG: shikimate dehydrogenase [Pseudomonadota bacterium]|jgi:shikimate dehydrogenase